MSVVKKSVDLQLSEGTPGDLAAGKTSTDPGSVPEPGQPIQTEQTRRSLVSVPCGRAPGELPSPWALACRWKGCSLSRILRTETKGARVASPLMTRTASAHTDSMTARPRGPALHGQASPGYGLLPGYAGVGVEAHAFPGPTTLGHYFLRARSFWKLVEAMPSMPSFRETTQFKNFPSSLQKVFQLRHHFPPNIK